MKRKTLTLFLVTTALLLVFSRQGATVTDAPAIVELLSPDSAGAERFGESLSLFSNTLVIGAPGGDRNGTGNGAVYVFTRSGASWLQQAMLTAEEGAAGDGFGISVSVSGDTIVIGAPYDDEKGDDSGAVYVFVRSGSSWRRQAKITADDGAAGDGFGLAAALDGDTLIVGAPFADGKGSAYTFLRSAGSWEQQAKLPAYGGGATGDRFGCSVAIGYDTILVGADGDDTKTTDGGAVHVYTPYGSGWRYQTKLSAAESSAGDRFGWSVAVGRDVALIGTNRTQGEGPARSGAANVFIRTGSTWLEKQRFKGDNQGTDDGFGFDVAIHDNFFFVGAPREVVNGIASGAGYLFSRSESEIWPLRAKYLLPDGTNGDLYGARTAIFGDTAVAGAPGRNRGAAYASMYPCSPGRYLPASEWQMISRPCFNPSPASTMLGDDIEGIFGKTWVIHRHDPARETSANPYGYFELDATEPLALGTGYWIYSVREGVMEFNGSATSAGESNECPALNGCVEIPLAWPPPGQLFRNNLVGNPFSHAVDWSDVVVLVTPRDGSPPVSLTPSEAFAMEFLRNSFYRYENKRYIAGNDVTPGMNRLIMPFESVWVHTLDPQYHAFPASSVRLLIPAAGPLKTSTP
jgi:hypothetical protein